MIERKQVGSVHKYPGVNQPDFVKELTRKGIAQFETTQLNKAAIALPETRELVIIQVIRGRQARVSSRSGSSSSPAIQSDGANLTIILKGLKLRSPKVYSPASYSLKQEFQIESRYCNFE
ncbi:hypothetical protein [Spirosoma telluris]|uniref:hypothetical protein n=1 Tax=Spirosoma telluris TaxID=2183553 RepID=UPI002FC2BBAD